MIAAIIQARMGSTRLPGKVLKVVNERPLLSYMVERVRLSRHINEVIIATTDDQQDKPIVDFCLKENIKYCCGSQEDVLSRYALAAKTFNVSTVVRLTSDCPLIDPAVIDKVIECYLKGNAEFVSNTVPLPCLYPDGMDTEVFSNDLLQKANHEAKLPSHREHVTFYMWQTKMFSIFRVDLDVDYSQYRFTVDYPQDFQLVENVLKNLYLEKPVFSMDDLISYVNQHPELIEYQKSIIRNAGWQKAFVKDQEFINKQGEKKCP